MNKSLNLFHPCSNGVLFFKYSAIAFQFVNVDLGPLKTVTVRHDNKGGKESWFINQVYKTIYCKVAKSCQTTLEGESLSRMAHPIANYA